MLRAAGSELPDPARPGSDSRATPRHTWWGANESHGQLRRAAGGSSECTFVNTVFFEGIPTLNQYGLALLALLMLGVGAIGFRRFV